MILVAAGCKEKSRGPRVWHACCTWFHTPYDVNVSEKRNTLMWCIRKRLYNITCRATRRDVLKCVYWRFTIRNISGRRFYRHTEYRTPSIVSCTTVVSISLRHYITLIVNIRSFELQLSQGQIWFMRHAKMTMLLWCERGLVHNYTQWRIYKIKMLGRM